MKAASAFTGIAGFERAFERHGIQTKVMIEWDPLCQRVLREHYPTTPLLGDICDVTGTDLGTAPLDLIYGGFPCQDTSIGAPNREGLAGKRSGNFYEFARLVGEYARIVDDLDPRWVVIENPDGLLKSPRRNPGGDMEVVVRTLEDLGYGWAYRVVDGRHCPLPDGRRSPQARRRVLVVGHRGGDPRPAWQVLGDEGASGEALPPRDHRRPNAGPHAGPLAGSDSLIRVWRKSANSQKSITVGYEGGYRETWRDDGGANTLAGYDGGLATRQKHLIAQHGRLRTLTLREWERLQGFPDDWTAMVSSDSARFTMLGNAMHVGMADWFARRLVAVHNSLPQLEVSA